LAGLGLAILFTPQSAVESREAITQVEDYRLGSHSESTRIIIQLSQDSPYRVLTNYEDQKVVMWIRNATLKPKVQSIAFKDKYLSEIQVQEVKQNVKFILRLKNKSTRLTHFVNHQPERIVIELKPEGVTSQQATLKNEIPVSSAQKKITKQVARKNKRRTAKSSSPASRLTQKKLERLLQEDSELKLKSGRKDYEKALKLFQNKNYSKALNAFLRFQQKYRESPLLANAAYMIAEAQYNLAKQNTYPNYEGALAAYQYAMRTYPESQFYDHSLFKVASIYEDMDYTLEARTLYSKGTQEDKSSRYNTARETGLGFMLIEEDKLDDAYETFQALLRKSPQNAEAKKGLFQIAMRYYEAHDFPKALKIFEDVIKRWPDELNEQPEVNYYIAEIYFNRKQYPQARRFYFNLVNLARTALATPIFWKATVWPR
jgi:TolA-binding protein